MKTIFNVTNAAYTTGRKGENLYEIYKRIWEKIGFSYVQYIHPEDLRERDLYEIIKEYNYIISLNKGDEIIINNSFRYSIKEVTFYPDENKVEYEIELL